MRAGKLLRNTAPPAGWLLCALILLASGCAKWGAQTSALPPAPMTPGAVVTETAICIPHNEAAELMLWIEQAEGL